MKVSDLGAWRELWVWLCGFMAQGRLWRWVAWGLWVSVTVYTVAVSVLCTQPRRPPLLLLPIVLALVAMGVAWIWRWLTQIRFEARAGEAPLPQPWRVFWGVVLGYLASLALCGYFTSPDTHNQWQQVLSGRFNDWHPVLHTACLWLVSRVWRAQSFVVAVQMGLFAGLCAWQCTLMRRYGYRAAVVWVVVGFAALSPWSMLLLRVLWKDTAFALAGWALTICTLHLWHTRGRWLWHPGHIVLLLAVVVMASFLRHNGIFLTLPLLVLLPCCVEGVRQRLAAAAVGVIALLCLVGYIGARRALTSLNGPIEPTRVAQTFPEAVGLPMTMLGEAFVREGERVPPAARELLLKMGSETEWREAWQGTFNSVKFAFAGKAQAQPGRRTTGQILNEEVSPRTFFMLCWETFKAVPKPALAACLHLTALAWAPFPATTWEAIPVTNGLLGRDLAFLCTALMRPPIGWLFSTPGFYALLWVVVGTYALIRHGLRALPLFLPFLFYLAGTALLLTGWDARFFYVTALCIAPTLAGLLHATEGE